MFRILGPLQVVVGGLDRPVSAARQRKILAALALAAGRPVPLERLIDAAWDGEPPATAAKQVRNAVSDLRKLLAGAAGVDQAGDGYRLATAADEVDAAVFAGALRAARDSSSAEEYRAALALWRGPALVDVPSAALRPQAAGLDEQRLSALEECAALDLAAGRHHAVVEALTVPAAEHPLRERLAARLALAHHQAGEPAPALAVLDRTRRALAEELGIDPGAELRRLHQRVLTDEPERREPAPGRCDLPADATHFTGRVAEIRGLAEARSVVAISAIDGMAGVGKTALAVHAAYRFSADYPDAQLFVDLHGHTPGREPRTPASALAVLLRAVGVPGESIPDEPDERAALWRATVRDLRAVVVLDNAADAAQVRPLLPGRSPSLTLVTSRQRLTGLDDACVVSLDTLPPDDARALFAAVVGDGRPSAEPAAVDEVLRRCGYLPLAIRIAASRLRHRPVWTVAHLAGRLRDRRLGELHEGVAAAFALSYDQLPGSCARLFRLLGAAPGPDIDAHAAAALAGCSRAEAEDLLEELTDAHLVEEPAAGRYRCHDLLRAYAADLADADADAARARLADFYLHTAAAAMDVLAPSERGHRPPLPATGLALPPLDGYDAALAWLTAESANLVATAADAAASGPHLHACHLSSTLWRYFHVSGNHDAGFALHHHALHAARAAGSQAMEAETLASLGYADWWLGRYEQALEHCEAAVAVAREIGNDALEGRALHALGLVLLRLGRDAEPVFTRMSAVAHAADDPVLEAYALRGFGDIHNRRGEHGQALAYLGKALAVAEAHGNRSAEGFALTGLGDAHLRMGALDEAASHLRRALATARGTGNRTVEIRALNGLGEVGAARGDLDQALGYLDRGLALAERTGDRYEQARAHRRLAEVRERAHCPDDARRHRDAARDLYTALGVD